MFILRKVLSDGVQINTYIGEYYVLVRKEENTAEFEKTTKLWDDKDVECAYAVLTYEDGSKIMPLYKGSSYYIMASDGQTFDNVSLK